MKTFGLTKSGHDQTRGVLVNTASAEFAFKSNRNHRFALPLMALAIAGLSACAPKPEAVVAPECPPPVTSYAKDGTLITLSEPCVLPERFEIAQPVAGAVPAPLGDPAEQDNGGLFAASAPNGGGGGTTPPGGGGTTPPGGGGGGTTPPGGGGGGGGKTFETKKEALQRVYGKDDWHNLEGNDYEAVRDYYLEHRKTDNNWIDFKP